MSTSTTHSILSSKFSSKSSSIPGSKPSASTSQASSTSSTPSISSISSITKTSNSFNRDASIFRRRLGFSLVELIIAIVVLAILGTITFAAGSSSQKRARITAAMTVLDDYESAFETAMLNHAGIANDRKAEWTNNSGATGYSSERAFSRLVEEMNKALSADKQFKWDSANKYWVSTGTDPWGGNYLLLEHPTATYWDASVEANKATMSCSIWASGADDNIRTPVDGHVTVTTDSVGMAIISKQGTITKETYGDINGPKSFTGNTIHVQ